MVSSGEVSGFEKYETSLDASCISNGDGSYKGKITNEDGDSAYYDVPRGMSFEDSLYSPEGQEALERVSAGASITDTDPYEYMGTAYDEEGKCEDYRLSFEDKGDGTYTGRLRDEEGNEREYTTGGVTIGDDIRYELTNGGSFDTVSAFEPVEGRDGVYHATGTRDDRQTEILATDKGIHGDSRLNSDSDSFMYQGEDRNGNHVKYDVNVGRPYGSSERPRGGNRAYGQRFEEEYVSNANRENLNGQKSDKRAINRQRGRKGSR